MAFEDWAVDTTKLVPAPNPTKNPYTGLPIDPDGMTMSRFEMTLTHVPSGKVLQRSDLISTPDAAALTAYAQGVIAVVERNLAAQDGSLIGPVNVVPQTKPDTRPQADKDLEAYRQADAAFQQQSDLVAKLALISPKDADALTPLLDKLKAVRDAAAAPVIDAVKAAAADALAADAAVADVTPAP